MADHSWLWSSCCHSRINVVKVSPIHQDSFQTSRLVDNALKSQMLWAGSFIDYIPVPVCLIDRKGFVHYTNSEFNSLVKIEHSGDLCPFAGKYMQQESSDQFRGLVATIADSSKPTIIPVVIIWKDIAISDININMSYVWTLSGSSLSAAVVLTGSNTNMHIPIENDTTTTTRESRESKFTDEISNMEKFRRN